MLDLVTDDSPNSPITGSNLEISVYRGQHTILPPTPPPDYIEGDLVCSHFPTPVQHTDRTRETVCIIDSGELS